MYLKEIRKSSRNIKYFPVKKNTEFKREYFKGRKFGSMEVRALTWKFYNSALNALFSAILVLIIVH